MSRTEHNNPFVEQSIAKELADEPIFDAEWVEKVMGPDARKAFEIERARMLGKMSDEQAAEKLAAAESKPEPETGGLASCMTLREFYAGLALNGLFHSHKYLDTHELRAELAFAQADAMLAAAKRIQPDV